MGTGTVDINGEFLAAAGGVLGTLGFGARYLIERVSRRQTALETKQENDRTRAEAERVRHELKVEQERIRWEKLMQDQIVEMRREIRVQERQIDNLTLISDAYLRHISALEALMRAAGIQIPHLILPQITISDEGDDR